MASSGPGARPSSSSTASRPAPWASRSAALEPGQAGDPAQRVALPAPVPEGPPAVERPLAGRGRVVVLVGQVALVGMALQQLGQLRRGHPAGEAQRPRVLGGRLPVGAERGGAPGGRRRMVEDGGGVARRLGMVGQPGRVRGRARLGQQRGQGAAVQVRPATRGAAPAPRPGGPARAGRRRRRPAPGASRRPRTRRRGRARRRPPRPAARSRPAGPPPRRRPGPSWPAATAGPPGPARRPARWPGSPRRRRRAPR